MRFPAAKRIFFIFFFLTGIVCRVQAQPQDEFMAKLQEVYTLTGNPKKALETAKEMFQMIERSKDLQTYSNYYLLKQIFEKQAPDAVLAKLCQELADKAMAAMVGKNTPHPVDSTDPSSLWYSSYYPALFSTKDPENASRAVRFLNSHTSFKNFNNYTFIAYAFERNGDFQQAKENYDLAISLKGNDKEEYHSYLYYTNFLARTGDYLKAEEYIRRMEILSEQAVDLFKASYRAEAMSARVVYFLSIGDYHSYIKAATDQYDYITRNNTYKYECDPYPGIRFTTLAFAKEMLKEYGAAESLWKSRDSVNYAWVNCHNKQYPNNQYSPISLYPVFLIKRGKKDKLPQPSSFYINETETHFNSYSQYADISVNFMKASQLGFLGSPRYPALFTPLFEQIRNTRNFRESTQPFAQFAYFTMRDQRYEQANETYKELFTLNVDWINDVIFSFGEKAFVSYYNSKLKEGYENHHSFVKIAKEKQPTLYPSLSEQAYNNLLFTKSISLKGTQKRKEAFLKSNDPAIAILYEQWIGKKQQLIRQYFRTEEPPGADTVTVTNRDLLKKLQEEVNHLDNELATHSKDFKKYLKIIPPDWKTIRDSLKEGEAAIEMIRFPWRDQVYYSDTALYAAYIITKNSSHPDVVYLPESATELDNRHYQHYKKNILLNLDDRESYDHFWKPLGEHLKGIKKIHFSPDGIYHLINISTLKNPESGQFLVDEIEIHYTLSNIDIPSVIPGNTDIRTAVLIGRPVYKTNSPSSTPLEDPITRSFVRDFKEKNIPDLPGTEEEVLAIKKEMEKYRIVVQHYLKEQATEDKVYQLRSPDILHIATHGYWSGSGENATEGYRVFNALVNSGLLLSGVITYYSLPEYPDTYDGLLTAYEAQNLDLQNTSLVILSACETSLGYLDAGEGVYGLQRAFRAAGAANIITSLWKVDDKATKEFMILFYQEFLSTKNKHAAFLLAQKAIKKKYTHPHYWGGFVMVGE